MKIAVSSANTQKISGPAAGCNSFLVYETLNRKILKKEHIHLKADEIFSMLKLPLSKLPSHPLNGIDCLISESLGQGMSHKLTDQGIQCLATNGADPDGVVLAYLQMSPA
ncbi:NifB/NifX family molybdenum-iron cluster-binding protein [Thiosulfativibrio zosterae]|uniref:Dinitrogenase iron-molybdenum cofactor biosynthesis domain-containing protein n=1 Tax=Thiosulfativibrio zosterae TaxID=2675053 RepID=A0A6F8PLK1_9GAMM|nr:hypothetical protein [Thiosulfativibrio zosterae]BBP42979.1 hypothetical protein THMIRHAT_07250 [Thiosulfativibrio zosterae]